jgi:hypothetical protein
LPPLVPIACNFSNAQSQFDLETYGLVYNYNLASQVGFFRQHGLTKVLRNAVICMRRVYWHVRSGRRLNDK